MFGEITNCRLKPASNGNGFTYTGTIEINNQFYDISQPIPFSMFSKYSDIMAISQENIPEILSKLASLADGKIEKRLKPTEVPEVQPKRERTSWTNNAS